MTPATSTQTLLLSAFRIWAPRLTSALRAAGHTDVQPRHRTVLTDIDREGTTVSILAQRASIAPAAMGSLVDELERLGYVMRRTVAVSRPPLIVPTKRGVSVMDLIRAFDAGMERALQRTLGPQVYDSFRQALQALAAGTAGGALRHEQLPGGYDGPRTPQPPADA
jgi:DNA-binding MarR family transcriptional regulator